MNLPRWTQALALCLGGLTTLACAQDDTSARRKEIQHAYEDVLSQGQRGPAEVRLLDQATLNLPAGMVFSSGAPATRLMNDFGNQLDERFVGLVLPLNQQDSWLMVVEYSKEGYVSDSDSKDINADKLLATLRESTEASNKFRVEHGAPAMEVVGWAEPPSYDASRHALVWSVLARDKAGPVEPDAQTVNYNTRVLGREGYFSLNMIDAQSKLPSLVPVARDLIAATQYSEGKRYSDFNASTDHVAEYGLLALIGGVAAKKLGLLALISVGLLKAWKIVLVVMALAATRLRSLFKRGGA